MNIPKSGNENIIFKVCPLSVWNEIRLLHQWDGSLHDLRDGFIHFSTAEQLEGTLKKHFAGQSNLILLSIDTSRLDDRLRWEPSRGGDLFPHLYGPLPISAIMNSQTIDSEKSTH